MAHIHTEPGQHDFTVSSFIVRLDHPEPLVLLHMHRKLNKLLQIGGHIELEETPWQAMKHEIEEESGYILAQLTLLQPKWRMKTLSGATLHPYPVAINTHNITDFHMHTDISYAFVTHEQPTCDLALGESPDLRWLTRAGLNELPSPAVSSNTREIYNFILDECLAAWERVPTDTFCSIKI